MKNVILVGDSIRLGYQDMVKEMLGDEVHVFSPDENCRYTKYALWGMWNWMERWGSPRIDVIHWNTGIWDLHRCTTDGEVFTPLYEYIEVNRRLANQMKSYSNNLIWATIIPGGKALDGRARQNALINTDASAPKVFLADTTDKWNADVRLYNAAVSAMLRESGVHIDDHYGALVNNTDLYISADGIHPTPEGYQVLAKRTVEEIRKLL